MNPAQFKPIPIKLETDFRMLMIGDVGQKIGQISITNFRTQSNIFTNSVLTIYILPN